MRRAVPVLLFACLALFASVAHAQTPAEIQQQINEHNAQIEALNKEIAEFEAQLQSTTKEKNTLQNKVSQLDLQRKQLNTSISITRNQIGKTELQIRQLQNGIDDAQGTIELNQAALGESLRSLDRAERQSLALTILSSDTVTEAWQDVDAIASLQGAVRQDIQLLNEQKRTLSESKVSEEEKRAELVVQQQKLVTQQGSLDATRRAQNDLLQQTKSQESEYQRILAEKQAAKAQFEAALSDLQEDFQRVLNPSEIPTVGKGILRWPVDNVRVTQYFGNTAFAASGAYNGKGHNGIDLGISIGTPLKAALSGIVLGTGNTDATRGCYSFGKWVMIRHNNGLSTMYAHLSDIKVTEGQSVATGQLIGYSGDTGYATGPHLHFGVYVTSVTEIIRLGSATNRTSACSNVVMPVPRSQSGYLNPLNYL